LFKWTRWSQKYANEVEKCKICQFAITLDSLVRFGWNFFHRYLARSQFIYVDFVAVSWIFYFYWIFLFFRHLMTLNDLCQLNSFFHMHIADYFQIFMHGTMCMEATLPFLAVFFVKIIHILCKPQQITTTDIKQTILSRVSKVDNGVQRVNSVFQT